MTLGYKRETDIVAITNQLLVVAAIRDHGDPVQFLKRTRMKHSSLHDISVVGFSIPSKGWKI